MITPDWFWNNSGNYNFISGPLPDITLIGGVLLWIRQHNCHVKWCWRMQWHPHPVHGHPVCKHHHPETVRDKHGHPVPLAVQQAKKPPQAVASKSA